MPSSRGAESGSSTAPVLSGNRLSACPAYPPVLLQPCWLVRPCSGCDAVREVRGRHCAVRRGHRLYSRRRCRQPRLSCVVGSQPRRVAAGHMQPGPQPQLRKPTAVWAVHAGSFPAHRAVNIRGQGVRRYGPWTAFLPWPLLSLCWWHCASGARQRLVGPRAGGRKQAAACSAATTQHAVSPLSLLALLPSLACRSLHCANGRHRLRAARQLFLLVIHAHTGLLCEPY